MSLIYSATLLESVQTDFKIRLTLGSFKTFAQRSNFTAVAGRGLSNLFTDFDITSLDIPTMGLPEREKFKALAKLQSGTVGVSPFRIDSMVEIEAF